MKLLNAKVLALCASHNLLLATTSSAFVAPSPAATNNKMGGPLWMGSSYLDNLQGGGAAAPTRYTGAEQEASLQGGALPSRMYDSGPRGPLDWNDDPATLIQGNSLRTWALPREDTQRVKLSLRTEGRPLTSNIELWQGPDYTPMKLKVYSEDGNLRPFNAVVETPMTSNTIAIYNTGNMEFPFYANVEEYSGRSTQGLATAPMDLAETTMPRTVQGGSITSYPFPPEVASVQFLLKTDGRNLKARVELMHGPNNDKQVMEFYSSDGYKRPFYAVVETPGSGNVVRIINQNTMEFPFSCLIAPFLIDDGGTDNQGVFVVT